MLFTFDWPLDLEVFSMSYLALIAPINKSTANPFWAPNIAPGTPLPIGVKAAVANPEIAPPIIHHSRSLARYYILVVRPGEY